MECSGWNCFVLEVFLQRDINMWFINHWYCILRDKFLPHFLVQHVDKVYILSLLRLESTWLNMELAQAWVDSEAGLIQMLTVTGILIAAKIWKSILFICSQILTNSWNPVMQNSENQGKFSAWFCGANSLQLLSAAWNYRSALCHPAGGEVLSVAWLFRFILFPDYFCLTFNARKDIYPSLR